jgi:hypothetical protein
MWLSRAWLPGLKSIHGFMRWISCWPETKWESNHPFDTCVHFPKFQLLIHECGGHSRCAGKSCFHTMRWSWWQELLSHNAVVLVARTAFTQCGGPWIHGVGPRGTWGEENPCTLGTWGEENPCTRDRCCNACRVQLSALMRATCIVVHVLLCSCQG